jgi:glycosyltransferase involved in cell wall biosynthesis
MKKILILLTKRYPFGVGEEFIQPELKYLVAAFERVIIIACQVSDLEKQTRSLPNGVECIRINYFNSKNKLNITRYFWLTLKGLGKVGEPYARDELNRSNTFRAKLAVLYYLGKMSVMYPRVKAAVDNLNLHTDSSITFYSYWLFDIAHIACLLRNEYMGTKNCYAVSRAHGYDLYAERNMAKYLPFQKYTVENLDAVFACSNHGRERLRSIYQKQAKKIETSYLGTDDWGEGRKSDDNIFRIVTCSWLTPIKRIDLLERSLVVVQKKYSGIFQWTCLGGGQMLNKYKAYAEYNLQKAEVQFSGAMTKEQIFTFYKNNPVDLFINVSKNEGLPVSIMEAQSFGIPVLATDVGGTREIVLNSVTGQLLGADCTEHEIADRICEFIAMKNEKISDLRSSCRKFWLKNFKASINYEAFVDRLQSLYNEME